MNVNANKELVKDTQYLLTVHHKGLPQKDTEYGIMFRAEFAVERFRIDLLGNRRKLSLLEYHRLYRAGVPTKYEETTVPRIDSRYGRAK